MASGFVRSIYHPATIPYNNYVEHIRVWDQVNSFHRPMYLAIYIWYSICLTWHCMCICTHTYIHTYIHIYIYKYMYLVHALSNLSNHHYWSPWSHHAHDACSATRLRDLAGLTLVISPLLSLMRDQVKGAGLQGGECRHDMGFNQRNMGTCWWFITLVPCIIYIYIYIYMWMGI